MTPRRDAARAWPATAPTDGALVPRRRSRVHGVEIDAESVLYDERSGRLHLLNSSASVVWWLIDGKQSVDALCAAVADRFADPNARDDVRRLLQQLGSEALIEVE